MANKGKGKAGTAPKYPVGGRTYERYLPAVHPTETDFGTQGMDWQEKINYDRMRKYKLARAKEQMKEHGLEAILTTNEYNVRYVTSTNTPHWTTGASGLRYALMSDAQEQPILYEQGEIGWQTEKWAPWLGKENVKYAITGSGWISIAMGKGAYEMQRQKFVDQIKADLKDWGLLKEPLGLDFWDPGIVKAFQDEGMDPQPLGGLALIEARKIKSKDEIECLRTAARICEAAFYEVSKAIRPGARECDLVGLAHYAVYRHGGRVYSGIFAASGPHSWPNPREFSDRMIAPGDMVYMDTYNVDYNGYKTCFYRTFSCGQPSEKMKDIYQENLDWLYDAITVIKPGCTTKDIAEQWPSGPKVWADIGIVTEDQTAGSNWMHGIGHSLYEPPLAWRATSLKHPLKIEEGMTFAIETQHGDAKTGQGVRIEEMIAVTDSGVDILTRWPIDEITVCPI